MKHKKGHITTLVIIFTLLTAGCLSSNSSDEFAVSLTADKDTYTFGEFMLLQVTVKTSESMENVTIEGNGLVSSKGPQVRLGPRTVDLLPGTNIVNFTQRVPSCSPCTKLDEGRYNITASVSYKKEVIAEVSCTVTLTT